jgi:hypothetical protein
VGAFRAPSGGSGVYEPIAASAPPARWPINPSTACGVTVTSESTNRMISPFDARTASLRARAAPPWHGRMTTTSASDAASAGVPSKDPSSITTIS